MRVRASSLEWSVGAAGPILNAVPDDDLLTTPDPLTGKTPSWRDFAACQFVDPELFYPVRGESSRQAKAVCASCPSAAPCLEFALTDEAGRFGVWAGTSDNERRKMRRQRARQRREAEAA